MSPLDELRALIKQEADKLLCETHPNICELRDRNYDQFVNVVLREAKSENYETSIQTIFAIIETNYD